MDAQRKKNLRALANLMNKQNVRSIPITAPMLECFDIAITPEETAFLIKVEEIYTYSQLAALSDLPENQFASFLDKILKKGLIWNDYDENNVELFRLPGIMLGWFETYLGDGGETEEKKEFARRVDNLFKSWSKLNFFPLRSLINYHSKHLTKTTTRIVVPKAPENTRIDINKDVDVPLTQIYIAQDVVGMINKYGDNNQLAVMHCFCRQYKKMVDDPCSFNIPSEACIVVGSLTQQVVKYGIGRYISKEEAMKIVKEAQKKGGVHQVVHDREDFNLKEISICNCCWDCCVVFGAYNKGILPIRLKAYYYPRKTNNELCVGCGRCAEFCPVGTISIIEKKSKIDLSKCIGCGQCEIKCKREVICLEFEEREVILSLRKKSQVRTPLKKKK